MWGRLRNAVSRPVRGLGRIARGNVRQGLGDIGAGARAAAPVVAMVPGVGTLAAAGMGAAGGALERAGQSGANFGSVLGGAAGGAAAPIASRVTSGVGSRLGGTAAGGDGGGFFGSMFRGLTGGEGGGFREAAGNLLGGEGGGFRGAAGSLLGTFGGMARDAISSVDPMQAAMLPFAIQEARQASRDREFSRDLAHQGIDHFGQAADIAMGDWEQRAPMRDAFIEGAMGFHEQHNPFATDPMAGMGGPQQPPPQQQMPEIQGPPSLDHLMQNPGFVFGGGGGGGGGGHPAPVSGGYPADPQFGPNEIPVDGIHQRII